MLFCSKLLSVHTHTHTHITTQLIYLQDEVVSIDI